jgi:hypothetical protein
MIEIEVDEAPELDARLLPQDEATKGVETAGADVKPLHGCFSIGTPVVQPFTDELAAQDKDLGQFLVRERDYRFHLVHVACTFRPERDTPFEAASLQIRLQAEGGAEAIAWSMSPERLTDSVHYSRKIGVTSELKVFEVNAETEKSGETRDVYVEASGLLQSDPAWEFTRTDRVPISGSHRLFLVVRAPRDAVVTGDLELSMTLRLRRLGIIPYRAELPNAATGTFRL